MMIVQAGRDAILGGDKADDYRLEAVGKLYHAYFTGLILTLVARRPEGDAARWMEALFRHQHHLKFLSSFEKLGLAGLPHAQAAAAYHYLSNRIGGVGGEIAFYFFGRWKGREFVLTNRLTRRLYPKGKRLVDKYGYWGIFVSRYMVGMRAIAGVIFGIAKMNPFWYILLQCISVSTWAVWIGVAGYFFGLAINNILGDIRRYQLYFFTIVGVGLLFWWGLSHIRQVKLSPRNALNNHLGEKSKAEGAAMAEGGK